VNGSYAVAGAFNRVPNQVSLLTGAATAGNAAYFISPRDMQTPYVQSFNFMVQRDLGWATVLDAGYVGALGRQLPYTQDINAAIPGGGTAGLPYNVAGFAGRPLPSISVERVRIATTTHSR